MTTLAILLTVPVGASAAPRWLDGVSEYQPFANCSGGQGNVISYTGYWGDTDGSYPLTDDRYWGHIVVGISGNPCAGGEFVSTDVILPGHTSFQFGGDAWGRVRCFYTSPVSGQTTEETDNPSADCRQNPGPGYSGYGSSLGGRSVPSFGIFEVIFPIKTTQPLGGSGTNDRIVSPITTANSSPSFAAPQQWVWVFQRQATDPPPSNTPPPEAEDQPPKELDPDPEPVTPREPDQPPADTVAPESEITKTPKKKTVTKRKKAKAKFKFASDELGVTFECKLDRSAFKPCVSPYKRKVKPGKHKFQVRATDAAGNTGTVMKHTWKVVRKKR